MPAADGQLVLVTAQVVSKHYVLFPVRRFFQPLDLVHGDHSPAMDADKVVSEFSLE